MNSGLPTVCSHSSATRSVAGASSRVLTSASVSARVSPSSRQHVEPLLAALVGQQLSQRMVRARPRRRGRCATSIDAQLAAGEVLEQLDGRLVGPTGGRRSRAAAAVRARGRRGAGRRRRTSRTAGTRAGRWPGRRALAPLSWEISGSSLAPDLALERLDEGLVGDDRVLVAAAAQRRSSRRGREAVGERGLADARPRPRPTPSASAPA